MPKVTELGFEPGRQKPQSQERRQIQISFLHSPTSSWLPSPRKGNSPTTAHEAPQDLPATSSHSPPHSSHRGSSLPLRNSRHPPTSRSLRWLPWGLELSSHTASTPTSFRPLLKCHLPSQGSPQHQRENEEPARTTGRSSQCRRRKARRAAVPGAKRCWPGS